MSRTKSDEVKAKEEAAKLAKAKADQADIKLILADEQLATVWKDLLSDEGMLKSLAAKMIYTYRVKPDAKAALATNALIRQLVERVSTIRSIHDDYVRKGLDPKLSSISLIRGSEKAEAVAVDPNMSDEDKLAAEMAKAGL